MLVYACTIDEGPTIKRWRARARGRVARIKKRTCHITVKLVEAEERPVRPAAPPPAAEEKPKRASKPAAAAGKPAEEKAAKPKRRAPVRRKKKEGAAS